MPRPDRHRVEGQVSLHAGGIDTKGKVAITDLKRRSPIVNEVRPNDVILRHNSVPFQSISLPKVQVCRRSSGISPVDTCEGQSWHEKPAKSPKGGHLQYVPLRLCRVSIPARSAIFIYYVLQATSVPRSIFLPTNMNLG